MSRIRAFFAFTIAIVFAANAVAADSLYVLQMGDGVSPLSTSAAAVIVKKYTATSTGVISSPTSILMPIADSGTTHALTVAGNSGSEGHLALSGDANYLTLGGYDAAPGTANVAQTDSAATSRVIGRITVSNNAVNTTTALTDAYPGSAGNNAGFRSVVSSNGTDFWTAGTRGLGAPSGSDGVHYSTLGSTTSTTIEDFPNGPSNTRVVNILNGQLYMSSASSGGSGSNVGVNTIGTGLPTTSGQTATLVVGTAVSGTATASPYDFWFKDASTAYVADDRGGSANGGGIQKWTFDGSSWNLQYILDVGSSIGARGLTGHFDGTNTLLWATNTGGQIVSITDTGPGSVFSVRAVAPANTTFRGLVFVPGPVGVVGDYNANGIVDAADYVLWRKTPSSFGGDPAGYTTWRSRFGSTSGSGADLGSAAAVPEPTGIFLLAIGIAAAATRRRER
jgi:hypothetical protein